MNRYLEARLNDDGKTWYLNEYRWDEKNLILRRETLANGLSRADAELLVKRGNQFLNLLSFAKKTA